ALFVVLYLFNVVRKFESPVVHRMTAVPPVALAGGLAGWLGIAFALRRFGIGPTEKEPAETSKTATPAPPADANKTAPAKNAELDQVSRLIDETVAELPELELPIGLVTSSFT